MADDAAGGGIVSGTMRGGSTALKGRTRRGRAARGASRADRPRRRGAALRERRRDALPAAVVLGLLAVLREELLQAQDERLPLRLELLEVAAGEDLVGGLLGLAALARLLALVV